MRFHRDFGEVNCDQQRSFNFILLSDSKDVGTGFLDQLAGNVVLGERQSDSNSVCVQWSPRFIFLPVYYTHIWSAAIF